GAAARRTCWGGSKPIPASIPPPEGTPGLPFSYLSVNEVTEMFCTRCGSEMQETSRYCPQCGHATKLAESTSNPYTAPRLALDTANKKIAGVCAGFARYL